MVSISKIPPVVGILCGIVCYELSDTVLYLIQPLFFPTLLRVIGMLVTLYFFSKTKFVRLEGNMSTVFSFLMIWSAFILLRGSLVGNFLPGAPNSLLSSIRSAFLNSYGGMVYFLPIVALVKIRLNSLYYIKRIALFLCLASLFMMILARDQIAYGMLTGGMTTIEAVDGSYISVRNVIHAAYPGFGIIVFCLFCYNFLNTKFHLLFPISIFIFFIGYAIGGGRGMTFFSLVYLLVFFYLTVKYPLSFNISNGRVAKGMKGRGFAYMILGLGFAFLLVYIFNNTSIFDYVLERAFGEKTIGTGIESESRNILVHDMLVDFNSNPLDWVWGRGVNGTYATTQLSVGGRRAWMEISYYYFILKGGVVFLCLFVYCFAHAMFLGFFRSRNVFSKCMGFMCLAMLINLLSASAIPQFSTFYVISWFCFGLLERRDIRMMSDEDVYGYFNNKNYIRLG